MSMLCYQNRNQPSAAMHLIANVLNYHANAIWTARLTVVQLCDAGAAFWEYSVSSALSLLAFPGCSW